MKSDERKTVDDSLMEQFKTQIERQRDRKILLEEKGFCRIGKFLVHSRMCFTDEFLNQIVNKSGKQQRIILKKMHNIFLEAFRWALKASVHEEGLNLPRFLIRLQEHVRLRQKRINLSNYNLLHSLALEPSSNGMLEVFCCFVADLETANRDQRFPLINFSISKLGHIKGRIFDPHGREIVDILNPRLKTCDWFNIQNFSIDLMFSKAEMLVQISEGES